MTVEKIGKSKIIMQNSESKRGYFGWPTVAKLKDGRIAASASGFRLAHICPFGKAVISFSEDGGENFSYPVPAIDTVLDDRDAGLCPFGTNGLVLTSFNNTLDFQRKNCVKMPECYEYLNTVKKEDEEKSIGSELVISFDNGKTFGKIFHSPITSPHGPIELKDGRILWVGRLFSENDSFTAGDPFIRVCEVDTRTGNINEIGRINDVYENGSPLYFCEPHAIELPDGKLICHIRENIHFTIWQSESYDGGRTWTDAHKILGEKGGSPAHLILHSSGVLISVYGYRCEPYCVKAMFSEDGGKTWDSGHILSDIFPTCDLGYPSSIELDDGSLLTVFYAPLSAEGPSVIWSEKWRIKK